MDRELLDEDGENQAVRAFLMAYGEPGLTVARMRRHMELAGWPQAPEWNTKPEAQGHLTKGGAQDWLRHLFALESSASGERSAFEAWFSAAHHDRLDRNMPDKSYNSPGAECAWGAWQARAALSSPQQPQPR